MPISTLEISTLSYVATSFIVYGFWWHKPYDIQVPFRIPCTKLEEAEEREYSQIKAPMVAVDHPPYSLRFWNFYELMMRFPAYHSPTFKNGMLAISVIFGGIHLAAWGDSLPTSAEGTIWKVCSILSTITAPTFFYIIRSYGHFSWPHQSLMSRLRSYSIFGVAVIYILVRLILTIEPFAALRSVPAGVYQNVRWVTFLPHMF